MGSYLWSEGATKRHEEAQMRERAYQARLRRDAAAATEAAWREWNAQEARARLMQLDTAALAPAEDAGWRDIGKATAALLALIEDELAQPYEDVRANDADAAGYGYRSGGTDGGDRGIVIAELEGLE
jgi:hypothetical protein